ncbi:SPOR domain-containing protein [Vibrio aerogenes]|nr:SPOR domain-containing protein [Vibrio aerogenes]
MEKRIIVGMSAFLLAACSTGSYVSDVTVETHKEDYPAATVQKPVVSQNGSMNGVTEEPVVASSMQDMNTAPMSEPSPAMTESKPEKTAPSVVITAPTKKDMAHQAHRFGYTVQVIAVGNQAKVDMFASKLPQNGQPVWENYKVVNGTKWYTILFGDFATRAEAKNAIQTLPQDFRQLKPFVKSLDAIKNSEYPTLNKLN